MNCVTEQNTLHVAALFTTEAETENCNDHSAILTHRLFFFCSYLGGPLKVLWLIERPYIDFEM